MQATTFISSLFKHRDPSYELLPASTDHSANDSEFARWHEQSFFGRWSLPSGRALKILAGSAIGFLLFVMFAMGLRKATAPDPYHGLPTYKELFNLENNLPQNNPDLAWPEGKHGRFIKIEATYDMTGLNNQLQDIIMSAQLAYMTNRAYVFQDYIWDRWANQPVVQFRGKWRSSVIPLTAFIDGPAAGGPMGPWTGHPSGSVARWNAPRAVRPGFFEHICPPERQTILSVIYLREKYGLEEGPTEPTVDKIFKAYQTELLNMTDTCVVLRGDHVFTYGAFGERIIPAFDLIKDSPVLTQFGWSALVRSLVQRNVGLLLGQAAANEELTEKEFSGLLAVHLRRGDFLEHCTNLLNWGAIYNGWNSFPSFKDKFPFPNPRDATQEQRDAAYQEHCLPSVEQVFHKIQTVKTEWEAKDTTRKLKRVYLMTNAEEEFKDELKSKLLGAGWEQVAMSSDMVIGPEEVEVDNAADMMIGQMAEVFIGNGFSSLSSNINLFRMARRVDTDSIRIQ